MKNIQPNDKDSIKIKICIFYKKIVRCLSLLPSIIFISFCSDIAIAYDVHQAHPLITQRAIEKSKLKYYLINNMSLSKGDLAVLRGAYMKAPEFFGEYTWFRGDKTIEWWLITGASNEDSPACRAKAHFHNPIHPGDWLQSYLTDSGEVDTICGAAKYSDVTWATGFTSPVGPYITRTGQDLGWDSARNYFYISLLSQNTEARESYLADAFRAIGHVMHLLQDASVPAHVRNDMKAHLWSWPMFGNPYEHYVSKNTDAIYAPPVYPTFLNPLRLTDFWDANVFNGDNPSAATEQGLAEYSNANFVSDYTIFKPVSDSEHYFKYPSRATSVRIADYTINDPVHPGRYVSRKYFKKIADGETDSGTGYRLAGVGYIIAKLPLLTTGNIIKILPPMDDYVHEDYAQLILPRAVGYSVALLDYFFRGTLEISPPKQHVYAIIDGSQNPQRFTRLKAQVKNTTRDEPFKGCTVRAVARYKVISNYMGDLSMYPPTGAYMDTLDYSYSVSLPIEVTVDPVTGQSLAEPTEFTFDFSGDPIPAGITDLTLQVVAKGTLGNEADLAVAVGTRDLSEPNHHVIWNLSDMFSLDSHLYTSDRIMSDPQLAEQVDLNHNGIFSETGEPYIAPFELAFDVRYGSEANAVSNAPIVAGVTLPGGGHSRLIGIFDLERPTLLGLGWSGFGAPDRYISPVLPAITQGEGDAWQATPAVTFRHWLEGGTKRLYTQHYKVGIVRCKPLRSREDGSTYCVYPEEESIPAARTPVQAVIY